MENWKESSTIFIWIIYILFMVIVISLFVIYVIRKSLILENNRKKEVSLIKEKHLKEILKKHIQTQEYERERIGSDLHDTISNKLNLVLLKLRVNYDKNIMEDDINDIIYSVRMIAHDLNPPMIEKIPIDVLIMAQFDKLKVKYDIHRWSKTRSKITWSTDCKIQIIRIIQELINNIIKHSKATKVVVKLLEKGPQLFLVIEDNGVGISTSERGMGYENIENRLFIIGGKFKIKSAKDKGTRIIIALKNGV